MSVRKLVGHFSEDMTDRYNHPEMADLLRQRELAAPNLHLLNGHRTGIIAKPASNSEAVSA